MPTLADSMSQGPWAVGTAADVDAAIGELDDLLGLTDLVIFPAMPGDSYARDGAAFEAKLACVSMAPFGLPVVPLV